MPNSGHGGPPGTRVMTIFVFYVSAQIPNIEYFEVYGGLQAPGGISSFFSRNFPSNAVRIMSGDQFVSRVMTTTAATATATTTATTARLCVRLRLCWELLAVIRTNTH